MMSSAPVLPPGAARQRGICRLDLESSHLDSPSLRSYRGRMKVAARRQGSSAPPQARAPSRRARESLSLTARVRPRDRRGRRLGNRARLPAWLGGQPGAGHRSGPAAPHQGREVDAQRLPLLRRRLRTIMRTIDGEIVNIEGDPRSPHNEGSSARRARPPSSSTSIRTAPPRSCTARPAPPSWESLGSRLGDGPGGRAGQEDARRDLRRAARERQARQPHDRIFSLGGATLDNEWNHIQQKLMRGLGIVAIENQARI